MNSKNPKADRNESEAAGATEDKTSRSAASSPDERAQDAEPIATFDEGERRPTSLESPDQGGLRAPAPVVSADPKDYVKEEAKDGHTEATMPPVKDGDPTRNTM